MIICTIGFTKKSLEQFISLLKENQITKVIDIRLNRDSQLAGFAKGRDLGYVLGLANIKYEVQEELAPSDEILKAYRKDNDWESYERKFTELLKSRDTTRLRDTVLEAGEKVCLLCSEAEADRCHRRLVAEYFSRIVPGVTVAHLGANPGANRRVHHKRPAKNRESLQ